MVQDCELTEDQKRRIEKSARLLYGLAHARYILTGQGLFRMVVHSLVLLLNTYNFTFFIFYFYKKFKKYQQGGFGFCTTLNCSGRLLPHGLTDNCHRKGLVLVCPLCEAEYAGKRRVDGISGTRILY
jgi:casein kinase II subunit beta